ncbi:hypothetical protein ILUMI_06923 [Ignelater luminosus]|uniref:Glucose-methanol-choline oxidoreductase N-terminal domain-containing protein n=1 Tax=Ignelater luminosus TaxID=2038154 RepID=A0A8K0D917_IGNLU|nr:hypothetical protein ILUMI_06923 [Ignelater luminosus]
MRRHLTPLKVIRALTLLEEGNTQRYVAERLGVRQSVVWRLWRQYQITGNVTRRHEQRCHRATTALDDRFLRLQDLCKHTNTERVLQIEFLPARGSTEPVVEYPTRMEITEINLTDEVLARVLLALWVDWSPHMGLPEEEKSTVLLPLQEAGNSVPAQKKYPYDVGPHMEDNLDIHFDFVIVGCVLANRLSEHYDRRILLVEAGDDPSSTSEVPAFYPTLQRTDDDWKFVTQPSSRSCQGMIRKMCRIPKGKALGGTTCINNLHYRRAIPKDFDNWASMGNPEWETDNIYFFYERLENYRGTNYYQLRYGTSAANRLRYDKLQNRLYLEYIESVGMLEEGTRHNMAKAFLTPIKNRHNFFALKNCYVTKITIPDMRERRAKGIQCLLGNTILNIKAESIGPAEMLKELNIPIVANLRVGENMQEHLRVPVFVGLDKNNTEVFDQINELIDAPYLFMMHRRRPLATTNINDVDTFINTTNPLQNPSIKANFLTDNHEDDLMTLVSGFKFIMRMVDNPPFVQHRANLLHIDTPNCRNLKFCTEFFNKCHIRNLAYPPDVVGTTKMGPLCDPSVVRLILWSDEANFSNSGMFNWKNHHYWSRENMMLSHPHNPQKRFSINVWCGLIGLRVIGPVFYQGTLTGARYVELLTAVMEEFLDNLNLIEKQTVRFQQDGDFEEA